MHEPGLCQPDFRTGVEKKTEKRTGEWFALPWRNTGEYQDNYRVNNMQNVSHKTGNEEAGSNMAEGNNIGTHVIGPGIVNVEQKLTSPEDLIGGSKGRTGTGQPGCLSENRGTAS